MSDYTRAPRLLLLVAVADSSVGTSLVELIENNLYAKNEAKDCSTGRESKLSRPLNVFRRIIEHVSIPCCSCS